MSRPKSARTSSTTSRLTSRVLLSPRALWSIPAVPEVTAAVFCLKFVRYCMHMWLPLYLIEHLNYSKTQGGLFSTMFDIGGIFGGPALGILVDVLFKDKPTLGIHQVL